MKKPIKSLITMLLVISLLMSNIAMFASYAKLDDYPVELAFDNLFVFEKWANNTLSTTIVQGGVPVENKLEINIEEGSFHFNNPNANEAYTGHGMSIGSDAAANYQYYYMEVEPNAAYTFSFNINQTTAFVTPYVFFFNENNEYISLAAQPFSGNGDKSFIFIVPAKAHYIQIRFTLPAEGYADVKNIAICKTETVVDPTNLFDFDEWATNKLSGGGIGVYNAGTSTIDMSEKSLTLTIDGTDNGTEAIKNPCSILFSGFSAGSTTGYYTIDTEPGKKYSLTYNLADTNLEDARYFQPFIVWYDSNGNWTNGFVNYESSKGNNTFDFDIPAGVKHFQIVFTIYDYTRTAGHYATVKDIELHEVTAVEHKVDPIRKAYTYSADSNATYGELPVPAYTPDGYAFAGWYTGLNGEGTHITANTPVHYSSFTVYPFFVENVDSLKISEYPAKRTYTTGETLNTTGLVLEATRNGETITIDSDYYCTPEKLTETGEKIITVHYGGKTAEFTVTVNDNKSNIIYINDKAVAVNSTNREYTFNTATGEFNRYEMTYISDAYVRGIMTYDNGATEEFFLEPSSNFESGIGSFASFIDGYLNKVINGNRELTDVTTTTHNGIKSISFELLDNKSGNFELLSVDTKYKEVDPDIYNNYKMENTLEYFENDKYKVGIDILNGGVVSYLAVLGNDIVARVYETTDAYNNVTTITRVDYRDKLEAAYGPDYIEENTEVNLINYYDNGRYLQQSYYGTREKPYEQGYYNRADWNYNPVQGGNVANEASKVIDYEIGEDYIYVKVRPLDWSKWSDEFADLNPDDEFTTKNYGEDYVTDTYVEAKYVFEDGLIKTSCRMVDYSGYPSAQTTQELPAFYTIEPLNHFVYNDVRADDAWKTKDLQNIEEPEFWGTIQDYRDAHGEDGVIDSNVDCYENWAAFTASADADSFGIGLYSPGVTDFFYGVYPQKYAEQYNEATGTYTQTDTLNYRHAETVNPAIEDDSSYIAPVGVRTFESFKPTEYSYYISTGTVDQIRDSFGVASDANHVAEYEKGKIAVPETIYMTPSSDASTSGQYYVNNIVNENGSVTLEAKSNNTNGYVQLYIPGAKSFTTEVKTVTNGVGEIVLAEAGTDTGSYENMPFDVGANGYFSYNSVGIYISGTGLTAGQTALAEWVFTVTMDDGSVRTYYAYSTLYAPNYHSVGATAEARHNKSNRVDGAGWISGIHTVSTALAPFGKSNEPAKGYGAFKSEPLLDLSKPMTPQGWDSANNLNASSDSLIYAREYYRDSSNGSSEQSPVGILYVDWSRNKNTNSIPNLYVGAEILRADHDNGNTSCHFYTYYTLGTGTENINNPGDEENPFDNQDVFGNNWTEMLHITGNNDSRSRYAATRASTLSSTTDLKSCDNILGDANDGRSLRMYTVPNLQIKETGPQYIYSHTQLRAYGDKYANIYTAVQLITVNKAELRDLVLEGTTLNKESYTTDSWNAYQTALKAAAETLGDPENINIASVTTDLESARDNLKFKEYDIVFDNLIDFSQWNTETVSNSKGTISNVTENGFTLNSNDGVNEATSLSPFFPVTPGKQYKIDIDITGDAWDVYIFFYDANTSTGTGIEFQDSKNRYSSSNGGNTTQIFTAPEGAAKAQIRVDANGPKNAVTFSNIRVYEVGTVADDVSYVLPITVQSGLQPESLPTPTRPGYEFVGWADADGNIVTAKTITPSDSTVYLTSTWVVTPDNASDDTVVIEYGLPVKIDVRSNDNIKTGTVNAIGTGVNATDISNEGYSESKITGGNNTLTLKYGDATLNTDGTITYTLNKTNVDAEDVFFYEVKEGNTYYYAKVTVIPATTLYYEDTFFTFTDSEGSKWTTVGTSVTDVFQDMDRAGESNVADELNKAYGYDSSFDKQVSYSGGTAHYVEVDQSTGSNGPKATFTFTGTGFDLFTATDNKSGTFTTTIYRGTKVNSANRVKGIISNAYFGYKYNEDTETYEIADNGTIYQVPVISEHDLDYGTYTVVVEPRYSKAFDVTEADKYGVYVDSVRIYNPMNPENEIANEAYKADGEYAPQYLEIRDTLVTPNDNGSYNITDSQRNISVFLDGGSTLLDDFGMFGPKNEVYLAPGDAIAFNIVSDNPNMPSTIQIGMKLTGLGGDNGGNNASVALMKAYDSYWGETITLNSTTERYYSIESVVDWEDLGNGTYKTKSPVVIFNTSSDAIISLTSIKWAFESSDNVATTLSLEADEQTPVVAMFAIRRVVDSDVQDDPQQTIPDTDNVEVVEPAVPDDKTDDITVDSDSDSGIMGIDSFITTLLTRLFNILKTVFDMLMGGVTA